jgi:hypothetical protein
MRFYLRITTNHLQKKKKRQIITAHTNINSYHAETTSEASWVKKAIVELGFICRETARAGHT